jgi:hypothetical protein
MQWCDLAVALSPAGLSALCVTCNANQHLECAGTLLQLNLLAAIIP